MSRGLGAVQRRVLDELGTSTADPMDDWDGLSFPGRSWTYVGDLAWRMNGDSRPTRSQVESIRRAVLKLVDAGRADVMYVRRTVTGHYAPSRSRPRELVSTTVDKMVLAARIKPDPDVQRQWDERHERWVEQRRVARAAFFGS